jgi:hypothetical protein
MFNFLVSCLPIGYQIVICVIGGLVLWNILNDEEEIQEQEQEEKEQEQEEEEKEKEEEENIKLNLSEDNINMPIKNEEIKENLFLSKSAYSSTIKNKSTIKSFPLKSGIDNAIITKYELNIIYFKEKRGNKIITGMYCINNNDLKDIEQNIKENILVKDIFKTKQLYEKFIEYREYDGISNNKLSRSYPNYF